MVQAFDTERLVVSKKTTGATVLWIEEASGEVRSVWISQHQLRGGLTYEVEAKIKYAVSPIDLMVVHDTQAGSEWSVAGMQALRDKAETLKRDRPSS